MVKNEFHLCQNNRGFNPSCVSAAVWSELQIGQHLLMQSEVRKSAETIRYYVIPFIITHFPWKQK